MSCVINPKTDRCISTKTQKGKHILMMLGDKTLDVPPSPEDDFREKVKTISERALDERKRKQKRHTKDDPVSYDDPRKYELVKKFIKKKNLKLYGGTAINMRVKKDDKFYTSDENPDYDVYSPTPWEHAVDLAQFLYKNGYEFSEVRSGVHPGTYKVFSNMWPVADLSYVPPTIYRKIPTTKIEGLRVINSTMLQKNMFKEFLEPYSNPLRWEKVAWRQQLLEKWDPVKTPRKACAKDTRKPGKKISKILKDVDDFITKRKLIRYGQSAVNKYLSFTNSKNTRIVRTYMCLSANAQKDTIALVKKLQKSNPTVYSTYYAWRELNDMVYSIKVGRTVVCKIAQLTACTPYKLFDKKYYVTVDYLKYMSLIDMAIGTKKEKTLAGCAYRNLKRAQQKYFKDHQKTEFDNTPFQRFVTKCRGPEKNQLKHVFLNRWNERVEQRQKVKKFKVKDDVIKIKGAKGKKIRLFEPEKNECYDLPKKQCKYPCHWDDGCFEIPKGIFRVGDDSIQELSFEDLPEGYPTIRIPQKGAGVKEWDTRGHLFLDKAKKEGVDLPDDEIKAVLFEADPTNNNQYFSWIMNSYINGGIKRFEDITGRTADALEKYVKLSKQKKLRKEDKNILDFCGLVFCYNKRGKMLRGLEDTLETYSDELEKLKEKKEAEGIDPSERDLIYDDDQIRIVRPLTEKAAIYYGRGTKWCTAAEKNNMFQYYNEKGPMYIILPKKPEYPNEKYQLHFKTEQYMNRKDEEVKLRRLMKKYSGVKKLVREEGTTFSKISANMIGLNDLKKFSKEELGELLINRNLTPKIAKLLLDAGADPNIINDDGDVALVISDSSEITRLLLDAGADPDLQSLDGTSALMSSKTIIQVKLLLDAGADPNLENIVGETALFYAETAEQTKLLLDAGADPNHQDDYGNTPLMRSKTAEQTKLLLNAGADPTIQNEDGETVLDKVSDPVIKYLLKKAIKEKKKTRSDLDVYSNW